MKIAVTGASGFVGRHVLRVLLHMEGVEVVAITRDRSILAEFLTKCDVVEHDISVEDDNIYEKLGCPDILLHLAWGGLPNYMSRNHFEVELPKQYNFIRKLVTSGLRSVSVVGTCFEYGMQSGKLCEDVPAMPVNPYGFAKDQLRKQLFFLQSELNFNLTWMRLFYIYGEDQQKNTLYSQLREAVERGEEVFNMSGGEQLRDYMHINDVAERIASISFMNKNIGIVNVCSGAPVSIRRLVENWVNENGWKIKLNLGFYPYPEYEPMAFWGDTALLNAILD